MNKNRQRCLGLAAFAGLIGACSVDTSDVHFVPDDVLDAASKAGKGSDTGNAGTGNTGADDAGGAPDSGGSTSMGGTGNKAGMTGKAGTATTMGGTPGTAGSFTAGNGPVGGMGGAMPMCGAVANRNEPLIDDFEDGNAGLPMPPLGGRAGGWYALNDLSPFGTQMPPAMDPTRPPKPGMPGYDDDNGYALYTSGKGFMEWGAGLGASFSNVPGMMTPCVYDAAIHTGIRFWVTGTITGGTDPLLHFRIITTDVADRDHAGLCDAKTETCYDNFNYDVSLPGAGKWAQVSVKFADLKQGGWGTPKKFYPNHLLNVEFVANADTTFNFGLDQIEFF